MWIAKHERKRSFDHEILQENKIINFIKLMVAVQDVIVKAINNNIASTIY